ncbi:MAG: PH domain-containing protein [Clostridia bacterium]|nr:PH domain-containing protein [Oscillospiraceae bacterium]MBQ2748195.1 PH domain-containing protein [Clostridia bacterium]MBQ4623287.1 PH domain-containing protein [Clostridia bacterium]
MEYIWQDRKRIIFGLPWTFTRYALTQDKLIVDTGFLNRCEDEIRLYRILDITLKRSLWERLFGLGTIHCCTGDQTSPEIDLKHIKNSRDVKNMLSDMIEKERTERRIGVREWMDGDETEEHGEDSHEN